MTNRNQGEGDKESARHFDEAQHQFARSGKVDAAARQAAPRDDREAKEMQQAEQAGKSHSKGEDPEARGVDVDADGAKQQPNTPRR